MNNSRATKFVCTVCDSECQQLHTLARCSHRFCAECCLSYIRAQADNFSQAKCLQEGCGAVLVDSQPVYSLLDEATKNKLAKFAAFQYLNRNTDARACRQPDCLGNFLITDKAGICRTCGARHCPNCSKEVHEGQCSKQEQQGMLKLNYRKCPKCAIWVEKVSGCEYISCKCGTEFCYTCGSEFSKDPCRKKTLWQRQNKIRQLLPLLKWDCTKIIPRILGGLILIPFTTLYCTVPLVLIVAGVSILLALFSPLVLIQPLSTVERKNLRCLGYFLMICFYPLIGALFILVFLIILLIYPFLRNTNHHGTFDPIDAGIARAAVWYLKFAVWVLQMP